MTTLVAVYLIVLSIYGYWDFENNKNSIMVSIDKELYNTASTLKYILPEDFHDRAINPSAISIEEDKDIANKLTRLIKETGFKYIYTIVKKKDRLFFIASDIVADPDTKRGTFYFYRYEDADEIFFKAFNQKMPTYKTVSDQWGTVRTVMIPEESMGGVKYLACVDYDISYVKKMLQKNLLKSIATSLFFMILAVPILIIYIRLNASYSESLRESEERLQLVMEGSQLGYWDWNIKTGEVRRNARWAEMLGYTLQEVELTVNQWTDLHHPDDAAAAWSSIQEHLDGKTPAHRIEYRMLGKDGQYKWILDQARVVKRDTQGRPMRMCGTHTDITERKQEEKEREKLQAQLAQAQKMESVGRLAGGVAHDFNNMLSVIIGHADIALVDLDPSLPLYERLVEIRKAGERSADLTRQLLAFARKQTISPKMLDLNETLEGMTKMLKRLIGEDIDLSWLPGDNVWPVKMDPSQIDQILANLCVNARDAIADVGKVTIETGNIEFDESYCSEHPGFVPGEYVLLAVSDNGCGMDANILNNIFEPFFTTKESGQGTGLGLATVYGAVKQNNGFVNVYSEPGQGTTFRIYLPRCRVKAEVLKAKVKDLPTEGGHETILLVEDEPAILEMTAQMLEILGYQVVAAENPGKAIRLAREYVGEIHLLVTDVVMPEMNGWNLANNILSIHPNIKRLFMSGYTANVIAHHGVLDPGVNFIQKPFSREQFGAKVRKVLDGGEEV